MLPASSGSTSPPGLLGRADSLRAMGRHSKQAAGPTATDRALLVAGAVLVGLVVLVSLVVVLMLGRGDGDDVTAEPGDDRRTTSAPPASGSSTTVTSPAGATPTADRRATPAPTADTHADRRTDAEPVTPPATLTFRVVGGPSWVRVTAGNRILVSGTFSPGDTRSFNDQELTVRMGDAGNVRLVVNGKARPPGPSGQIEQFTVRRG